MLFSNSESLQTPELVLIINVMETNFNCDIIDETHFLGYHKPNVISSLRLVS